MELSIKPVKTPSIVGHVALVFGAMLAALVFGYLVAESPTAALFALSALAIIGVVAAPPLFGIVLVLFCAIWLRGLAGTGLVPSVATYLDLVLAPFVMLSALMKMRAARVIVIKLIVLVAALLVTAIGSAFANHTELLRPVVYFLLLAEPFFLVIAIMARPPVRRERKILRYALLVTVAVQLPLALVQFAVYGSGDLVQGTLVGAKAGAHTMSGLVLIGAVWFLMGNYSTKRTIIVLPWLCIPLIADAKQVILAAPLLALPMLLTKDGRSSKVALLSATGLFACLLVILLKFMPAGETAVSFLERAHEGRSGKLTATRLLRDEMAEKPDALLIGLGPAQTLSRAAFMTIPTFRTDDSPLALLGLSPAELAANADRAAASQSGGGTSFNTGLSSAIGLFGDLGAVGLAIYLILLLQISVAAIRDHAPDAPVIIGGWLMISLLAIVFDWWEQPPVTVFLAVISGLACAYGDQNSKRYAT
jgi:hypothetical protein